MAYGCLHQLDRRVPSANPMSDVCVPGLGRKGFSGPNPKPADWDSCPPFLVGTVREIFDFSKSGSAIECQKALKDGYEPHNNYNFLFSQRRIKGSYLEKKKSGQELEVLTFGG